MANILWNTIINPWSLGQRIIWNFTCENSVVASYINQTKEDGGAAAESAVKRKSAKYSKIKSITVHLTVFVIITLEVW